MTNPKMLPVRVNDMKCPNCNKKISFTKIRSEFSCPHCKAEIKTRNYTSAFIIAVIFWAFIFSPVITIMLNGKDTAMLVDMTIGFLLAYLIFRSILKLEKR
jgi:predicted RNA-binding Zn-ribbon protein involved in translation (DUF1610 family)